MVKKELDKKLQKIHDKQAFKSQQIGLRYENEVFLAILMKSPSTKELVSEIGISEQALAKHLKRLKNNGSICKDVVKLPDGNLKIVWRDIPEHIEIVSKAIAEMGEWLPDYLEDSTDETVRSLIKKLDEEYATIAKIWSEMLNRLDEINPRKQTN